MPPLTTEVSRMRPEELGDKFLTLTNPHPQLGNVTQIPEPTALSVQTRLTIDSPTKRAGLDPLINVVKIRTAEQPTKLDDANPSPIGKQVLPRRRAPSNLTGVVVKPSQRRVQPSLTNIGVKDLSKRRATPKASRHTVAVVTHQDDRQQTHPCHDYAIGTTQQCADPAKYVIGKLPPGSMSENRNNFTAHQIT
jgi:hypothetical protein